MGQIPVTGWYMRHLMQNIKSVISDSKRCPSVPEDSAQAYIDHSNALIEYVDQAFFRMDNMETLIGGAPVQVLQDSHRKHVSFMSIVLEFNNMELLCHTVPWSYRTYINRGFQPEYFPIALKIWQEAVIRNMPPKLTEPIVQIYNWIIEHHQDWIDLSQGSTLTFLHPSQQSHDVLILVQKLLKANSAGCMELIQNRLENNDDISSVYLDLIQPALYEIGRKWELGEISAAQEHMSTAIVSRIMAQIYGEMPLPEDITGTAVITCAPNEFHEIGARMVADLLEQDGWDITFMGANTTEDDLISHLLEEPPHLLGISVSMLFNLKNVRNLISKIREIPELKDLLILVGGPGTAGGNSLWKTTGADGWAVDARDAVIIARQWLEQTEHRHGFRVS